MRNRYKFRVKGTFEFIFEVDEDKLGFRVYMPHDVTDVIAKAELPIGCTPIKKKATMKDYEKTLLNPSDQEGSIKIKELEKEEIE